MKGCLAVACRKTGEWEAALPNLGLFPSLQTAELLHFQTDGHGHPLPGLNAQIDNLHGHMHAQANGLAGQNHQGEGLKRDPDRRPL